MIVKLLEIRDAGTFIPILAVNMNPSDPMNPLPVETTDTLEAQRYLLRRCGYPCDGRPNIAISHLSADGEKLWNDPYAWNDRTYATAHHCIIDHWNELKDGDVVDIEFILGETDQPKQSERVEDIIGRSAVRKEKA